MEHHEISCVCSESEERENDKLKDAASTIESNVKNVCSKI
jgi:hypothetical protein